MNLFFAYIIKSSISLMLLYCLFRVSMRNDRNHSINRFLLLGILLVSAIIPFLNIQFFYEEIPLKPVETIREFVSTPVFTETISTETVQPLIETASSSLNPWLVFYLLVISALVFRLVLGVFKVMQIISRAEKRRLQKIVLAVVQDLIQPFTFLNKVVISEKDFTENKNIIVAHEHAHIKQLHTIDLMVCEVFTVMHFFNPFMWLLRRDLKLIHEYQADQAVLNKGIDAKKYQLLVLQKSVGERRFAMANHFTQKPILKRLKMMQQKNRKQWAALKLILFVPLLIVLLQAFARPETLIEKASEFVPSIIQKDSSEVWLNSWTIENISNINGGLITKEVEVKPPPPGYQKSGLPKYDKSKDGHPIPTANIFPILINSKNAILAASIAAEPKEVIVGVENFLLGKHPFNSAKAGPEFVEQNLPIVGSVKTSRGVIVVRYDRVSDKSFVNNLLRQIGKVHLKLREQKAHEKFQKDYFSLSSPQKNAIDKLVPVRVSIENKSVGKRVSQNSTQLPSKKQIIQSTNNSNEIGKGYDVIVYIDRIDVFNEICTISELIEKVEKEMNNVKEKERITVLSFSDVPKQRLDAVLNELHNIPLKKVSSTVLKLEPKAVSLAQHKILLKTNGKIELDNKEYNLNKFEARINQISNQSEQANVSLAIENDVTYLQCETVKRILREANIDQVGYSIQKHSVWETNPGTKIGEPSYMFGFAWSGSGPFDIDKLKRSAESFLSGNGNRSLYASISPDKNATQEDIEVARQVLLDAGFKKVEISKLKN